MENAIKLTAEELYYLGGQMQAKYIDYDYISKSLRIGCQLL